MKDVRKGYEKGIKEGMKRGQTEVIGLVVIVFLLVMIGVIYLKFALSKGEKMLPEVRNSLEANNMLNALIKANIEDKRFIELVDECYRSEDCEGLEVKIMDILKDGLQGKRYEFIVEAENSNFIDMGDCDFGISASFPFTKGGIYYEASLKIC